MNLSGILVHALPHHLEDCASDLARLPGVEVHHKDAANGRFIVVQEAPDVHAEIDGLRAIQQRPLVASAEMVYHYFDDDAESREALVEPGIAPAGRA